MTTEQEKLVQWVEREISRRVREEYYPAEEDLLPPELFSDEPAEPDDRAFLKEDHYEEPSVSGRLASSTCGWETKPTVEDFADAMRTEKPTELQLCIANVIIAEASTNELFQGYLDGYYTLRQLVQRMHDTGTTRNWRTGIVNGWRDHETA